MNTERKIKETGGILLVFWVFFIGTACNGGSNENAEPTRPPVSNLRYQDFYAEATQCYTRLTGCEPGEENRTYLSHVGERVRWTNNVSFNKGNTLVLYNGQGPIALLNIPSETINNLKVGTELTVEGTIVPYGDEYGWALDDVEIDPIVGIDTPQPEITIENVSLEVTSFYKVTFTLNNTSGQPVETCFFVSLSFDDDGYN